MDISCFVTFLVEALLYIVGYLTAVLVVRGKRRGCLKFNCKTIDHAPKLEFWEPLENLENEKYIVLTVKKEN